MSGIVSIDAQMRRYAEELAEKGKTPLFFAKGNQLLGIIAVADVIKDDSPQAVKELQNMGIYVVMLTGDNERTAKAIGEQAGVDEVIAGVLPDGKERVIRKLKNQGKVAMVGDGINDAPALTRADIGIPLAAGVWIPLLSWELNPMFGAAAMSLSSFCVVTNALRLNLFKVHSAAKDKKIRHRNDRHLPGAQ